MQTHTSRPAGIEPLIRKLDAAVTLGDVNQVTRRVKSELEELARTSTFKLPDRFRESNGDQYARRLLHRNSELDYTVVVMTWGPGQGTQLHDHGGMWCVECVLEGELDVALYELLEQREGRYRFAQASQVRAGVGQAGCLIPPSDYHVLANARADRSSLTLHVYGGDMDHCNLFTPSDPGWWEKTTRRLQYDS